MTDLKTAAQQALEALEAFLSDELRPYEAAKTSAALRAALAEPVQEPVAWIYQNAYTEQEYLVWKQGNGGRNWKPLYTAPPQRKPLTEEEIDVTTAQERDALLDHIYEYGTAAEGVLERIRKLCRAVERAHGIKE